MKNVDLNFDVILNLFLNKHSIWFAIPSYHFLIRWYAHIFLECDFEISEIPQNILLFTSVFICTLVLMLFKHNFSPHNNVPME